MNISRRRYVAGSIVLFGAVAVAVFDVWIAIASGDYLRWVLGGAIAFAIVVGMALWDAPDS